MFKVRTNSVIILLALVAGTHAMLYPMQRRHVTQHPPRGQPRAVDYLEAVHYGSLWNKGVDAILEMEAEHQMDWGAPILRLEDQEPYKSGWRVPHFLMNFAVNGNGGPYKQHHPVRSWSAMVRALYERRTLDGSRRAIDVEDNEGYTALARTARAIGSDNLFWRPLAEWCDPSAGRGFVGKNYADIPTTQSNPYQCIASVLMKGRVPKDVPTHTPEGHQIPTDHFLNLQDTWRKFQDLTEGTVKRVIRGEDVRVPYMVPTPDWEGRNLLEELSMRAAEPKAPKHIRQTLDYINSIDVDRMIQSGIMTPHLDALLGPDMDCVRANIVSFLSTMPEPETQLSLLQTLD